MRQRILHLPKWFPNKFDKQNGIFVDKHICSVSENYEQIVLSVFKDPDLKKRVQVVEETRHGVTYVEVSFKPVNLKLMNVFLHGLFGLTYAFKYAKGVSIIHTHVMGRNVGIGWVVSSLKSIKRIHTEHWSLFINPGQWKSKSKLYKMMTRFLLGQMNHVLTVSEPLNKKLLEINPAIQSEIIGNVISINPYTNLPKNLIFTFIHISDLRDDIKNISGVIDAFIHFKSQSNTPVQLILIGDGEDRQKLETQAKGQTSILFLGRQTNQEVYKAMNRAHCLILNSRIETFGMVILEAFSCGIPAICAKNGVTEYFVDKQSGLVIEQKQTNQLVNAMKTIQLNYNAYQASTIKEKAKPFSEVVIGNKIKRIYKTHLNEK